MVGPAASAQTAGNRTVLSEPLVDHDELGSLLDLALQATAATGAALLVQTNNQLKTLHTRGVNAPSRDEMIPLEGTVAGEAWYRSRLVTGPEAPPRSKQGTLWQDDRTIELMAAPVVVQGKPVAVFVLYHRYLGHFRRTDATGLTRLASIAAGLWGGAAAAPAAEARSMLEVRASARLALLAAGRLEEGDTWIE